MTDAPEAPATLDDPNLDDPNLDDPNLDDKAGQEEQEQTEVAVAAFRRQLEGQVSVPASVVQDGLLDLWGRLPEGEVRSEVERWLTETLERSLYSVADVDARLAVVLPGG